MKFLIIPFIEFHILYTYKVNVEKIDELPTALKEKENIEMLK